MLHEHDKLSYFAYLADRSPLRRFLRRVFIHDFARHFRGQVLDVGCGIGEFLRSYPTSIGVDYNQFVVAHCAKSGLQCCEASALALPFAGAYFDGVLLSNILEHLTNPRQALEEASRVLKPGGKIVLSVPTEAAFPLDPTHVHMLRAPDIFELARGCGLTIASIYDFPFMMKWPGKYLYFCELRAVLIKPI
ncbi:MAG: class I SAM-dependent methyltransferase [Nitrosomonas ureae]